MCKPDTHWHNLVYLPALIFVTFFLIMLVMASIRLEWQVGVLSDEIVATKESIRLGSGEQTQVHTHSCVGSPQDIQEASENFFSLWMTARITEVYQLGTKWALQVSTHMRTPVRYIYTYIYIYLHTYIHDIYIYIYIYIYIHT